MNPEISALVDMMQTLAGSIGRQIQIMEVCGTHTVAIFRSGIRSLLPDNLRLVSGPGCPVCVTAQRHIDAAIELAQIDGTIVATYGDMMRVPGELGSLERLRATGADVRVISSARTCLELAKRNPHRQIVLIAVGFETTTPATAATVLEAEGHGLKNFSILVSHKLVVPAMLALLADGDVPLDGFLCPGHVSVIVGADAYRPVVDRHRVPCVVAGFEPLGILKGLVALLKQVKQGRAAVENHYETVVTADGNTIARRLVDQVFEEVDTPWRALGVIPGSGLRLRAEYKQFDALQRFSIVIGEDVDRPACRCGDVIQGKVTPDECALFGQPCTPVAPLGPCMVSSEGTCSAWYKYGHPSPVTAVARTRG